MASSSLKTTSSTVLKPHHHYIALSVSPSNPSVTNELSVRKFIQNALSQTLGASFANTYLDILSLQYPEQRVNHRYTTLRDTTGPDGAENDSAEAVIRVASE